MARVSPSFVDYGVFMAWPVGSDQHSVKWEVYEMSPRILPSSVESAVDNEANAPPSMVHKPGYIVNTSPSAAGIDLSQIVLGRDVDEKEVDEMSQLFKVWTAGLFAWPFLDIPFSPFSKAMKARDQLQARFQSAIDLARAQAASGEQVEGVIRTLVECVDEEGNRWVPPSFSNSGCKWVENWM